MLRIDVHRLLHNQIVFFAFCKRFDYPVRPLNDELQFFILTGVQVFLKLAALALKVAVLINNLFLPSVALGFDPAYLLRQTLLRRSHKLLQL